MAFNILLSEAQDFVARSQETRMQVARAYRKVAVPFLFVCSTARNNGKQRVFLAFLHNGLVAQRNPYGISQLFAVVGFVYFHVFELKSLQERLNVFAVVGIIAFFRVGVIAYRRFAGDG